MTSFSFAICGLTEIVDHLTKRPTHVVSITDPDLRPKPVFDEIAPERVLSLTFDDVVDPLPSFTPPSRADVERIVAFADAVASTDEHRILVHCHAGVSRSTAATIVMLAHRHPDEPAQAIVDRVASSRPRLWPNLLMIEHADAILSRKGELVAALRPLYRRRLEGDPVLERAVISWGRAREIAFAKGL